MVSHFVCAECRERERRGVYRTIGLLAVVIKGERLCAICKNVSAPSPRPRAARSRKCLKLFRIVWSTGILLHIAENVLLCVS